MAAARVVRVVVVSGPEADLEQEVARHLRERGYDVVVCGEIDPERLLDLAPHVLAAGGKPEDVLRVGIAFAKRGLPSPAFVLLVDRPPYDVITARLSRPGGPPLVAVARHGPPRLVAEAIRLALERRGTSAAAAAPGPPCTSRS